MSKDWISDKKMKICEFEKNALEVVRIEVNPFNGQDYISIRVWFQDDKNIWKPSHKGITISMSKISELKAGIDKAYKAYEKIKEKDRE